MPSFAKRREDLAQRRSSAAYGHPFSSSIGKLETKVIDLEAQVLERDETIDEVVKAAVFLLANLDGHMPERREDLGESKDRLRAAIPFDMLPKHQQKQRILDEARAKADAL